MVSLHMGEFVGRDPKQFFDVVPPDPPALEPWIPEMHC